MESRYGVSFEKRESKTPKGVVEISEGVNLDTTAAGRITGIEILSASRKMNVETLLSYTLDLDPEKVHAPGA
jgi:uncharacterized protein YuzE